ncbi:hypothetical protein AKUH4B410M_04910 [Apilactobacillus kunkeei]|nr:hypothetical protein AKUH4B405J_04910 [Apilactobacillus kunkeei]CAI2581204.1 hypothetical protein AKUH4B102A_04930 [Apilactobacillus kunkeei]CAI2582174.1 hypothetical protein AKUH4B410M_04910 [Apilactobacillus kunkeei]CAI2653179.1 hypothetical protein AKUH3B102X_04900 [Apilactobacillus kunkeei]
MYCNSFCYHGSSLDSCNDIVKNKYVIISKTIGTLGKGFYSFYDEPDHAKKFAELAKNRKKYKISAVIKFKIRKEYYDNILNLNDDYDMELFDQFLNANKDIILKIQNKYTNKKKAKQLDGFIIDKFIEYLEKEHSTIVLAVFNKTFNDFGTNIPYTSMHNSKELCIKDDKIINYDTMKKMV